MIVKPFRATKYGTQMTQIRQMATDFFVANAMHFSVTLSEVEGSLNASYVISSLLRDPSTAVGMTGIALGNTASATKDLWSSVESVSSVCHIINAL